MESTGVLIAQRDRVRIAYEAFGPPKGEPLLLIMGLGMQMIAWHDGFLRALVEQGFQVARFDNRDVGLSTHFAETGKPSVFGMIFRPLATASYGLDAMANDALQVSRRARLGQRPCGRRFVGRNDRPGFGRPACSAGAHAHINDGDAMSARRAVHDPVCHENCQPAAAARPRPGRGRTA